MACRFCNKDSDEALGIVPLLSLNEKEATSAFGCRLCMIERGLWCPTHDLPHNNWNSGGHLCLPCHSLLYARLLPRAEEYYRFLVDSMPKANARALQEWAEDEDNWIPVAGEGELVLWSLTAVALIRNQPFRQLLEHVAETLDLEPVIPGAFPIHIP